MSENKEVSIDTPVEKEVVADATVLDDTDFDVLYKDFSNTYNKKYNCLRHH